jgi:hypothetical protein
MRPIVKILAMTSLAAMVGCAAHTVRCDERLEAINAPRPKSTPGANSAPSADGAHPTADVVRPSAATAAPATPPPGAP